MTKTRMSAAYRTADYRNMMYACRLCLLAMFAWVSAGASAGQSPFMDEYNVRYLTMDSGLPHNFIDDLCLDSDGYVWSAMSGGGLSRYDGYGFVNFRANSPRAIKSNFVMSVCEDPFKRLWVASDGGIDIIDLATLENVTPDDATGRLEEVMAPCGWNVITDSVGCVWVSSRKGVSRIKFDSAGAVDGIVSFNPPYDIHNPLIIRDVYGDGRVWTSLKGVVHELSVDDNGVMNCIPVSEHLRFRPESYVSDYVMKDGDVWITTDSGLFRYNRKSDLIKNYVHNELDPTSLSQNYLTAAGVTPDDRLVIGSLRGLNVYNPTLDNFIRLEDRGRHRERSGLNNNFINCLLIDGDRIWVGTEGGGINKFVPKRIKIQVCRNDITDPASLSKNPVNSVFQDSDGTVWVGTVEGGLNRTDSKLLKFEHFTAENSELAHNSVSAIAEDGDGRLWVGTWGGGIDVMNRHRPGDVLRHVTDPEGKHPLWFVGTLAYDSINNAMWIGVPSGLFYCDLSTGEILDPLPESAESATGNVASLVDRRGHLWVGGSNGLFDISLKGRDHNGKFPYRHLKYKFDNPSSKSPEKVVSLLESSDSSIWIGTNGNGVYRRYEKDGHERFDNYTTADGLANDIVLGLLEGKSGTIWAATYHGLSCIYPEGTVVNYDRADGLPGNQFYWNASCKTRAGKLVFGSVEGLVALDGEKLPVSGSPRPVKFTGLTVAREERTPGDRVSIHERDKFVGIEFSALDYDFDNRGDYYYRLSGFDKKWDKLPPGRHSMEYTNLAPGDYEFQIRYTPQGMAFDDAPVSTYPIEVRPYFYRTWWFIGLVAIVLIAFVAIVHRWRVRDLMNQRLQLRRSVEERTAEISSQKRLLEEKALELSEQNNRLKLSNEEITLQKTRLSEMARKVQELSVDRISFFTNITHEFRTPLTLIIGPIERALRLSYNPKVIEQLRLVERNSKYLLSLINQLMDFRKIESGKMEIVCTRGNFLRFITNVVDSFKPLASDRGIELRLVARLSTDTFSYDEESLRKVLINLLSNAIKFTPDNGSVTCYCALIPAGHCAEHTLLYIDVCDSGNGIDEAELPKVFERFYQGNSQLKYPVTGSSGSGIGLYLCKSIVEIYGGRIWAKNNPGGRGSSFRLLLPVELGQAESAEAADIQPRPDESGPADDGAASDADDKLTILVVEDNDDMRAFIRSILADRYSVVEARNGAEALRILMSRRVDFIISDLMMPVMDGLELSRRVKEDLAISHIPFLMLTAKTSPETKLESYKMGVDEYMSKPFDEQMLLARINNILENKRRQRNSFVSDMDVSSLNIDEDSRDKKFMDHVMEVIKENYKNSYFEVGDFAEALGISRSLLNKKLQSVAGQSAGQLIRSYRMNVARGLILKNRKTRTMNISEIAYEVGFNDSKYFTRCFTKQFGISPSAFMTETE